MEDELLHPPDPGVPDQPEPLPPARGHGFLAERLISPNGLVSLLLLSWSALVLRRPQLLLAVWRLVCRRCPWLIGSQSPP